MAVDNYNLTYRAYNYTADKQFLKYEINIIANKNYGYNTKNL